MSTLKERALQAYNNNNKDEYKRIKALSLKIFGEIPESIDLLSPNHIRMCGVILYSNLIYTKFTCKIETKFFTVKNLADFGRVLVYKKAVENE